MTRDEVDKYLPLLEAFKDGELEFMHPANGKYEHVHLLDMYTLYEHPDWYRRKPKAVMVPLGPQDVKPGDIVREAGGLSVLTMLIICVWRDGVRFFDGVSLEPYSRSWEILMRYEISRDGGKTWEKCCKEAVA